MDKAKIEHPPIDNETYNQWMREAEQMGMKRYMVYHLKMYGEIGE